MALKPIEKMLDAVEIARSDFDMSLFFELMYLAELVTKTVTAGLIAAIVDDRDRHHYRQLHRLVRAGGLGDWIAGIDDVLGKLGPGAGPPPAHARSGLAMPGALESPSFMRLPAPWGPSGRRPGILARRHGGEGYLGRLGYRGCGPQ
jgi:hypothetical protein